MGSDLVVLKFFLGVVTDLTAPSDSAISNPFEGGSKCIITATTKHFYIQRWTGPGLVKS
jgi:hypothetical protein